MPWLDSRLPVLLLVLLLLVACDPRISTACRQHATKWREETKAIVLPPPARPSVSPLAYPASTAWAVRFLGLLSPPLFAQRATMMLAAGMVMAKTVVTQG